MRKYESHEDIVSVVSRYRQLKFSRRNLLLEGPMPGGQDELSSIYLIIIRL